MQRSLLEIRQIHGHLGQPAVRPAAAPAPSRNGIPPEEARIFRAISRATFTSSVCQIDIERDQDLARSDNTGASRWMQRGATQIRRHVRTLEASAPAIFEVPAILAHGRGFVEVHRHSQTLPNLFAGAAARSPRNRPASRLPKARTAPRRPRPFWGARPGAGASRCAQPPSAMPRSAPSDTASGGPANVITLRL